MSEASFDRRLKEVRRRLEAAAATGDGQAALDTLLGTYALAARELAQAVWVDVQGGGVTEMLMARAVEVMLAELKATSPMVAGCGPNYAALAERTIRDAFNDEHRRLDAGYATPRGRA